MLRLRYCPTACVRPQDLKLIPGVTDNTPGTAKRYKNTTCAVINIFTVMFQICRSCYCAQMPQEETSLMIKGQSPSDAVFCHKYPLKNQLLLLLIAFILTMGELSV